MAEKNGIPTRDGEITEYVSDEARVTRWFDPNRVVLFVNGMGNTGKDHQQSCLALSLLQMCKVIGLYNKTSTFALDLSQCLWDKYQFDGPRSLSPDQSIDLVIAAATARGQKLTRRQAMETALARNPGTLGLFKLLHGPTHRRTPIFAHSQGNLLLSNTLSAIKAVEGVKALEGREVRTFGSPCMNWPAPVKPLECGFTWDPVTWLAGFDFSLSISKVGAPSDSLNPITHSFAEYMKSDPAFVINRFRWGSLGITVSMDEKGLANAMIGMGRNVPRVKAVFERLWKNHRSDVDDVAKHYIQGLQASQKGREILDLVRSDLALKKLLIQSLEKGWTTGKERDAINVLKTG
jgi:hypothetical protein